MRTLSGELTLSEAALRVDLSGADSFTVIDHRGRVIGTFDASLLNATPILDRATILVGEVARHGSDEPMILRFGRRYRR